MYGEEPRQPDSEIHVEKDSAVCPGSLADGGRIYLRVLFRQGCKLWILALRFDTSGIGFIEQVCNVADVGIFMETDKERLVSGTKVVRTRFPREPSFSGLCHGFWALLGQSRLAGLMPLVIAACKASAIFGRAQK